jgi:hypothetical protein
MAAKTTGDGDLASLTAAEVADRTRLCLGADGGGTAEAASAVLYPRQPDAIAP